LANNGNNREPPLAHITVDGQGGTVYGTGANVDELLAAGYSPQVDL